MKRFILGLIMLVFWGGLIAGGFIAWEAHTFLSTPGSSEPKEILIVIEPGATFDRVAWDLYKGGAITDVTRFRFLAHAKDALGKIRAGEFVVNTGWTPEAVLRQITEGRAVLYKLALREGLTWWETARAIEEQGFATYEDFKAVIHDPAFLRAHAIPFANAEGFLFPDTYLMKKPRAPLDREQARIVASLLVNTFWKKTQPLWKTLPEKQGSGDGSRGLPQVAGAMRSAVPARSVSLHPSANASSASPPVQGTQNNTAAQNAPPLASINGTAASNVVDAPPQSPLKPENLDPAALRRLVILASLVEKETGVPAERARVAGVYANRLVAGMLLQCDPTIIYGVGETFSGAIRRSQIDDPKNLYNTYQHPGLPPGPICSSGFEAIKAAAAPEKHDFYYFVATGIDAGHTFSKTLSEHNQAVQVYRSRMRGRQ